MNKLFKAIYNFMRTKTDLEITVWSLTQCLYTRGLNSFKDMSVYGQKYWIDKTLEPNLCILVDKELERSKTDKKWIKEANKTANKYGIKMIKV